MVITRTVYDCISIQKKMAPVWSFDVIYEEKVWERLYDVFNLSDWKNQTQWTTYLETYSSVAYWIRVFRIER